MEIIKDKINDISVTYIKTSKFKTVSGFLSFKKPFKRESITVFSLLGLLMSKSCKKYNTLDKLTINCLNNYDASYISDVTRYGNYMFNLIGFNCINDKFINDSVIDNTVDTFCELIYNPNVSDKKFDKNVFDIYYKRLKTIIETKKERPKIYGYEKLLEKMDKDSTYAQVSTISDLEKLNRENMYEYYLDMINNSEIQLYLIGDFDYKKTAKKILSNLKSKTYDIEKFNKNVINKDSLQVYKESLNTSGSIVFLGLKLLGLTPYEKSYVMPIYSCILGGGASSRSFNIIREKNSLAYFCHTKYDKDDQILTLIAGIDKKNFEKTKNLMLEVLDSMKKINEDEIIRAKNEIITSLKEIQDDPIELIFADYIREFYEEDEDEKRISNFQNVTIEEVLKLNDKIYKDSIYMIEGDK